MATDPHTFVAESLRVLGAIFERPTDRVHALGRPLARRVAEQAREALVETMAAVPPAEADPVHGLRVGLVACALGERRGLGPDSCAALACGALMHDLGKTLVPAEIRERAPLLDGAERELYLQHPELSLGLLIGRGRIDPLTRDAVLAHHERLDGTGTPYGLEGEAVPLGGRLVAVADAYDAWMRRPGRRDPSSALAALQPLAPGLDPLLVELLAGLIEVDGIDRAPGPDGPAGLTADGPRRIAIGPR